MFQKATNPYTLEMIGRTVLCSLLVLVVKVFEQNGYGGMHVIDFPGRCWNRAEGRYAMRNSQG
jgi:hypothetical protein